MSRENRPLIYFSFFHFILIFVSFPGGALLECKRKVAGSILGEATFFHFLFPLVLLVFRLFYFCDIFNVSY